MAAGMNSFCYGTEARKLSGVTLIVHEGGLSRKGATKENESEERTAGQGSAVFGVIFAVVLILALFIVGIVNDSQIQSAKASALEAAGCDTVCVSDGDSLWSIAERHGVDGVSTSDIVDWIISVNDLSSSCLLAGQKLVVPA